MTSARQFCTFYLDHLLFGVESQKIQEVVTYRELRPVPLAPPVVSGLMNLRGQVVVALELRRQLELPDRPADMSPICLVVRAAGGTVCLLADEVGNVVEVEEEDLRTFAGDAVAAVALGDSRSAQARAPVDARARYRPGLRGAGGGAGGGGRGVKRASMIANSLIAKRGME
jgi:purine-binding chemotaxis protein CheW